MRRLPLLALLLTFLLSLVRPTPAVPSPPPVCPRPSATPPNITLYVLAMQWPFSICSRPIPHATICNSPPPVFTIQGLWPTNTTASPTCCPASYTPSTILDIAPALRRFWPDFSARADEQALWERQWLLHGSCTRLSLRAYFRKVLELSRRYDFIRALNSHAIVAGQQQDHPFAAVQAALDAATGDFRVRVRCLLTPTHQVLDAVHICLDTRRFDTVSCPAECHPAQDGCCDPNKRIRIPYWRHEHAGANQTAPVEDGRLDHPGFWVGHVVGFLVLAAGVAYWLFKQFLEHVEQNRSRPIRVGAGYTPITAN